MRSAHPVPSKGFLSGGLPVAAERAGPTDRSAPHARAATHDYSVVMLVTGGRSRVEQRGEWALGAGDVLLVPAGQAHRLLEMQRSEYWGLGFCAPCFAAEGAASLLQPLEHVRDGAAPVVAIPAARQAFLEGLFRELEQLTHGSSWRPGEAEQAVRTSLLTLILAEVERARAPGGPRAALGAGVVVDSLRYIERNCLQPLSLRDVAAAVGRSPAYVTAALSQATGLSAGAWIVSGRMAEARRLLLHSDERVEAIAERVGYADVTHFIRMFRRAHELTPAGWRAARRGG
ncbi:MAG: AraC family transcriptional regulator [Myxococcales bacterium]|nr:MAG: AraC family transcriptional regulator [Myxococcales bacterium]